MNELRQPACKLGMHLVDLELMINLRTGSCEMQATQGVVQFDAGIAIRHSRGYTFSILQGLKKGWKGWTRCVLSQEITKKCEFRYKITKIRV